MEGRPLAPGALAHLGKEGSRLLGPLPICGRKPPPGQNCDDPISDPHPGHVRLRSAVIAIAAGLLVTAQDPFPGTPLFTPPAGAWPSTVVCLQGRSRRQRCSRVCGGH